MISSSEVSFLLVEQEQPGLSNESIKGVRSMAMHRDQHPSTYPRDRVFLILRAIEAIDLALRRLTPPRIVPPNLRECAWLPCGPVNPSRLTGDDRTARSADLVSPRAVRGQWSELRRIRHGYRPEMGSKS